MKNKMYGGKTWNESRFYQLKALNVKLRKSRSSPLLVLGQVEVGDLEGVPPARHTLAQGKRSSRLLRVGLEMGLLCRNSYVVYGSVVPHRPPGF